MGKLRANKAVEGHINKLTKSCYEQSWFYSTIYLFIRKYNTNWHHNGGAFIT